MMLWLAVYNTKMSAVIEANGNYIEHHMDRMMEKQHPLQNTVEVVTTLLYLPNHIYCPLLNQILCSL